jgi:8-oxo-dGTP diphosphatase
MPRRRGEHAQLRLTADVVILTIRDDTLHLLVIERGNEPFKGAMALPGGFVSVDESVDTAALRELQEETHIDGEPLHLEQVKTYSAPDRDPRGRVVTVAFLAIAPDLPDPKPDTDARSAEWVPVERVVGSKLTLAFDHRTIVLDCLERAREKLETTSLATAFCSEPFTIADLRKVYEAVWSTRLDPGNFSRKVTHTEGFLVPTGQIKASENGRPPALYQRGEAVALYPPMLRSRVVGSGSRRDRPE